jgi:hypothetical protein
MMITVNTDSVNNYDNPHHSPSSDDCGLAGTLRQ